MIHDFDDAQKEIDALRHDFDMHLKDHEHESRTDQGAEALSVLQQQEKKAREWEGAMQDKFYRHEQRLVKGEEELEERIQSLESGLGALSDRFRRVEDMIFPLDSPHKPVFEGKANERRYKLLREEELRTGDGKLIRKGPVYEEEGPAGNPCDRPLETERPAAENPAFISVKGIRKVLKAWEDKLSAIDKEYDQQFEALKEGKVSMRRYGEDRSDIRTRLKRLEEVLLGDETRGVSTVAFRLSEPHIGMMCKILESVSASSLTIGPGEEADHGSAEKNQTEDES